MPMPMGNPMSGPMGNGPINSGPSPELLQRLLPMIMAQQNHGQGMGVNQPSGPPIQGPPMGPPMGSPVGGPIDVGSKPPAAIAEPPGLAKPFPGMANKMSPNRPGMWGKYNQISQALQPLAMRSLMNRR